MKKLTYQIDEKLTDYTFTVMGPNGNTVIVFGNEDPDDDGPSADHKGDGKDERAEHRILVYERQGRALALQRQNTVKLERIMRYNFIGVLANVVIVVLDDTMEEFIVCIDLETLELLCEEEYLSGFEHQCLAQGFCRITHTGDVEFFSLQDLLSGHPPSFTFSLRLSMPQNFLDSLSSFRQLLSRTCGVTVEMRHELPSFLHITLFDYKKEEQTREPIVVEVLPDAYVQRHAGFQPLFLCGPELHVLRIMHRLDEPTEYFTYVVHLEMKKIIRSYSTTFIRALWLDDFQFVLIPQQTNWRWYQKRDNIERVNAISILDTFS